MRSDLSVDQAALTQSNAGLKCRYCDSADDRCTSTHEATECWRRQDALAQSDAEPVAWQYRWKMELIDGGKEWSPWHDLPEGCVNRYAELPDYETRPLYTALPRPDASAEPRITLDEIEAAMERVLERRGFHAASPDAYAGLIEAAEYLTCYANDYMKNWINDGEVAETLIKVSGLLRARAADRSGK